MIPPKVDVAGIVSPGNGFLVQQTIDEIKQK
jgi:hypothetical protein